MMEHSGDQCISDAASRKQSAGTRVSESMLLLRKVSQRSRGGRRAGDAHEDQFADADVALRPHAQRAGLLLLLLRLGRDHALRGRKSLLEADVVEGLLFLVRPRVVGHATRPASLHALLDVDRELEGDVEVGRLFETTSTLVVLAVARTRDIRDGVGLVEGFACRKVALVQKLHTVVTDEDADGTALQFVLEPRKSASKARRERVPRDSPS